MKILIIITLTLLGNICKAQLYTDDFMGKTKSEVIFAINSSQTSSKLNNIGTTKDTKENYLVYDFYYKNGSLMMNKIFYFSSDEICRHMRVVCPNLLYDQFIGLLNKQLVKSTEDNSLWVDPIRKIYYKVFTEDIPGYFIIENEFF